MKSSLGTQAADPHSHSGREPGRCRDHCPELACRVQGFHNGKMAGVAGAWMLEDSWYGVSVLESEVDTASVIIK